MDDGPETGDLLMWVRGQSLYIFLGWTSETTYGLWNIIPGLYIHSGHSPGIWTSYWMRVARASDALG